MQYHFSDNNGSDITYIRRPFILIFDLLLLLLLNFLSILSYILYS